MISTISYFDNHFYNPNYFNPTYNQQVRSKIDSSLYFFDQDQRVLNAVHAFTDMLNQVEEMDGGHQEQALLLCLLEMAKKKLRYHTKVRALLMLLKNLKNT